MKKQNKNDKNRCRIKNVAIDSSYLTTDENDNKDAMIKYKPYDESSLVEH